MPSKSALTATEEYVLNPSLNVDVSRHLRNPLSASLKGGLLFCIAMKSKSIFALFMNNSG